MNQNKGLIALGLFKDYDDIRNSPTQKYGPVMPGDIKYKDVNGDGVVDDNDIVAVGATNRPNLDLWSWTLLVKWKGLDDQFAFSRRGQVAVFLCPESIRAFSEGAMG